MKGRKPKDLSLRILQGNPSKRPLSGGTAPFTVGQVKKPKGLDRYASEEWDRLTHTLAPILSPADRGMLLIAADAFSQLQTANKVLQQHGMTYESRTESGSIMVRQRPEVRIKENARRAYHQALAELGASPVAHTRVRRLPDEKPELDGMAKFLQ